MTGRIPLLVTACAVWLSGCAVGGQAPHTLARTAQPAIATPVTD